MAVELGHKIKPPFLDFFAGSGLVTEALKRDFKPVWANDICKKKAAVFKANHPAEILHVGPVECIKGNEIPFGVLSWASFPCQDLSLAGNMNGIASTRSGLVWQWIRVMDEMPQKSPIVVAENVIGLVSAAQGEHYKRLHNSLVERGYRVGALVLDAAYWVPQSRQRVFVVGVDEGIDTNVNELDAPSWCHPKNVQQAAKGLKNWVWWRLERPKSREIALRNIISLNEPWDDPKKTEYILSLIPVNHRRRMELAAENGFNVFTGYRRIRNGRQVLEIRFDGLAGCLRTPNGGSSRQVVVARIGYEYKTRLLTVAEAAALMGVRKSYKLPGSYNDGYRAMGDAVAVPAAQYLSRNLLAPLAKKAFKFEVCLEKPAQNA